MQTLAITAFDIPGDRGFPLNALYAKPKDRNEAGIYTPTQGHIQVY